MILTSLLIGCALYAAAVLALRVLAWWSTPNHPMPNYPEMHYHRDGAAS